MRTESELRSTRDRYTFRALSTSSNGDHYLARFLDWVLDPTISDLELVNIMETINDEPDHTGCCQGEGDCCTKDHCPEDCIDCGDTGECELEHCDDRCGAQMEEGTQANYTAVPQ
jgi:hypothetical protein